ncbi:MAG: lysophospholipid acyltransferase family protein [Chthoniobacterales bacterium]
MKIEGWPVRWLIALTFPLLKLWIRTLRFEIDDRGDLQKAPGSRRYIGALWHNRLLLSAHVISHFTPVRRGGAALISASRDGALIADVVGRYGFQAVRGSSSRHGTAALRQLADVIASGRDPLITPDGPRGPIYRLGGGIIFLAQKASVPVQPINFEYSSCWRLNSWDRFIVPKPFSKVRVIFGEPHLVRSTSSDEEFEAERVRLENAMMSLVEMR